MDNMSRVRKLTDIEIDEVSVVDRPANQHGLIAFSKSVYGAGNIYEEGTMPPDADVIYDVEGDEVDPGLLEHGDVVYDGEGNEYVFVEDDEEDDVQKGVFDSVARQGRALRAGYTGARNPKMFNDMGTKQVKSWAKDVGINPKNPKKSQVLGGAKVGRHLGENQGKYIAGTALGAGGLGAAYALNKSAGDTVLEALSKAVSDDDRDEIIAKAMNEVEIYKAQTEEMAEALEYEQDLRITEEYISKAAEYNLPVSPEVLGPILKSIAEVLSDEELDILDAIFEAIGDTLYDEVGYVGDTDNASVVDMVDAYADELVGKSDLSHAEAAVAMYSAHPEAYEAYLAENGR